MRRLFLADPPDVMFEKVAALLSINKALGVRLVFGWKVMQLLGCSRKEVDAIKGMRYGEFSLERLMEFRATLGFASS